MDPRKDKLFRFGITRMVTEMRPPVGENLSKLEGQFERGDLTPAILLDENPAVNYNSVFAWWMNDLVQRVDSTILPADNPYEGDTPTKTNYTYLEVLHENNNTSAGNQAALDQSLQFLVFKMWFPTVLLIQPP